MSRLRLATWNIAWMTRLFGADGTLLEDDETGGVWGVTRAQQIDAITKVLPALDADLVLVVEAPDDRPLGRTIRVLAGLAEALELRADQPMMGFTNDTGQELALLYDPSRLKVHHAPMGDPQSDLDHDPAPRFDRALHIDLDIDDTRDVVRFSKPPLEALVTPKDGPPFRLIGCHVKSKAPHGARTPSEVLRRSVAARRKQLAQCIWLRRRIDGHLAAGDPLVVLGDLNDGPGLDEFEALFGRSGLEIVMGDGRPTPERLVDPHARQALGGRMAAQAVSARFFIQSERRWLSALLDYILLSADLARGDPAWRIWHPFDDADIAVDPSLQKALLQASDHYPVSVDLDV